MRQMTYFSRLACDQGLAKGLVPVESCRCLYEASDESNRRRQKRTKALVMVPFSRSNGRLERASISLVGYSLDRL